MTYKIAGIDPGLAATGLGIICGRGLDIHTFSYGHIQTRPDSDLPHRLRRIHDRTTAVLKQEKPQLLVIEDVFSLDKYPKSGISLGQVSGVILLAACQLAVPTKMVPVREAKQVLTGNGNASKAQLETAVRHLLKLDQPIRPNHAADALGMALIGLFRYTDNLLLPSNHDITRKQNSR